MTGARRRVWFALALCAGCASTADVYVGADLQPVRAGSGSAAGASDPPPSVPAAPVDAGSSAAPIAIDAAVPTPPSSGTDAGAGEDDARIADAAAPDAAPAQPPGCSPGTADCDGDASNGCEADLDSDMAHCGGCDRRCHSEGHDALTAQCNAGRCELTCRQDLLGDHDCDFNPDNGCESALLTDDQNCGQCGRACTCFNGSCI